MLAAGRLAGMYAASPVAAEVYSDVGGTYRAHDITRFRVYGSSPMLDVINLQYLGLPTAFCFHPGCYSLGNRRGQQFGPCLSLSKEITRYRKSSRCHRRSTNFKKQTYSIIVYILN